MAPSTLRTEDRERRLILRITLWIPIELLLAPRTAKMIFDSAIAGLTRRRVSVNTHPANWVLNFFVRLYCHTFLSLRNSIPFFGTLNDSPIYLTFLSIHPNNPEMRGYSYCVVPLLEAGRFTVVLTEPEETGALSPEERV
jgi:hypothetical protein